MIELCEKCEAPLANDRIVWLELSITDGRYYRTLPTGHESQGGFPFGKDCARKMDPRAEPRHDK